VAPNPNLNAATIEAVADGASYLGGVVSPGEFVVLFGTGLGPATLLRTAAGSDGRYPSSLAGWTVFFDEFPAPILYLSDKQAAVMVPFELAGRSTTSVTVNIGGKPNEPVSVTVAATNPAVFTADSSGSGIAAALNVAADGAARPNTANTPVQPGGVVTFFASGLGITTPVMQDGALVGSPLAKLNASLSVFVAGSAADILYAGPAPGQIAGLTQINIRIPANTPSGLAPLLVVTNDSASQPGVSLAVK
jgi:uncharacterized protein (TIGR03437 family)